VVTVIEGEPVTVVKVASIYTGVLIATAGVFGGASIPNLKNALGYTVPPITLVLLPIRGKDCPVQ